MRLALKLHPDFGCDALTGVDVEVARPGPGVLALRYMVIGRVGDLILPPTTAPARTDELWRHTCFEAFVRTPDAEAYFEFNLAPSTQWAAYRFDVYRQGMTPADEMGAPRIEAQADDGAFELRASLDLDGLPGLPLDAPWRLALSAVIEEAGGRKSYWALAHPPGQADFHHPDGFVLNLPTSERP